VWILARSTAASILAAGVLSVASGGGTLDAVPEAGPFPVTVRVDVARHLGPLHPVWRFFGADEPNYVPMTHGSKLLGELGALKPDAVYFRTHNLLTSGDGTPALKWGSTNAYREDGEGRPVYDWAIVDRIFDTLRDRGVRPYVEIGFMPQGLSTRPEPYRHHWRPGPDSGELFTGWAYPPKDYSRWGDLVYEWVRHCVERYGRDEVEAWYWETWNEANIGYWQGTRDEFLKLHDYAIDAVRRALPTARVGGPDMAGSDPDFLRAFFFHSLDGINYATGRQGTPLDFVAFHAKGSPTTVDGHVRMGISHQLRTIDSGFATVASFPKLRGVPVVIGESDPEGCAACQGPQLAYRNGTLYSSYTAASFSREHELADRHGIDFEGALTWAFEFEDQPLFAGFRALATNGLDLPVLNVFRMFSRMGGERIAVRSTAEVPLDTILADGVRGAPDVSAMASLEGDRLAVLVWHYHDDDVPGPEAAVTLEVAGLPSASKHARVLHYRIDDAHSNSYSAWKRMGSPAAPSASQYAELEAAGQLSTLGPPMDVAIARGGATVRFALPRQAVSLLSFQWDADDN
jgi:xylan 1,4-beta-xylosidase